MANSTVEIKIIEGIGKESKKPWKGLLITVGEWSQIVFPRSKFEMDHIEKVLGES